MEILSRLGDLRPKGEVLDQQEAIQTHIYLCNKSIF